MGASGIAAWSCSPLWRNVIQRIPAGARVLDVGCAGGRVARHLQGKGCTVVGVERDPTLAVKARFEAQTAPGVYQVTLEQFVSPVTNNVAYRRTDFGKLGGFSEAFRFPGGEDADLNWRLLESGGQLLMDPTLTVQHHDPDTLLGLWRQARDRASGIFPTMARRKTAKRRIIWTLGKQSGKFLLYTFPPLWPLVLVQFGRTAWANRRLLSGAEGWREAWGFMGLLAVADFGEVVGFLSGVWHYFAARQWEGTRPVCAERSGGA